MYLIRLHGLSKYTNGARTYVQADPFAVILTRLCVSTQSEGPPGCVLLSKKLVQHLSCTFGNMSSGGDMSDSPHGRRRRVGAHAGAVGDGQLEVSALKSVTVGEPRVTVRGDVALDLLDQGTCVGVDRCER